MDVLASAAMLEGMVVSSGAGDGGPAGERAVTCQHRELRVPEGFRRRLHGGQGE